ncbi:MAG TPA: RNA polymerase sigma factor [Thermoanaerobaculia bacterium]|nr:RNA polymerase sigma factor [Thermoanaerobaculia bacterium]
MHGATLAAELGSAMTTGAPQTVATEEDLRIAAACAAGDPAVFEGVYQRFGERMKSIAYNHLGNIGDAEDAVQEAFLKVHRAARSYTGDAAFATWIYRILVNTCYDLLRKRKRRPVEEVTDEEFERTASTVDETKRLTLRKLLNRLPEQRRSVFTLFEIEGLSHAEISQVLGITEANSKWILFSTKKQLQQEWKSLR